MLYIDKRIDELEKITSQALPASADIRFINPPAAWIVPMTIRDLVLDYDCCLLEADVYIIAPDVGTTNAHPMLSEQLDKLLEVYGNSDVEVRAVSLANSVTLPNGAGGLPAYRVSVTI